MFWPVIKLMLQEKIRLEQEALLVTDTTHNCEERGKLRSSDKTDPKGITLKSL